MLFDGTKVRFKSREIRASVGVFNKKHALFTIEEKKQSFVNYVEKGKKVISNE